MIDLWLVAGLLLAIPPAVKAQNLFRSVFATTASPGVGMNGTNSMLNVNDLFDESAIKEAFASFDPLVHDFTAALDLRGAPSKLQWIAGSGLSFTLLGDSVVFNSTTLDGATDEFESWLKGETEIAGSALKLTDLLQALVAQSPVDPVAGNPNSLQSRMLMADFRLGTQGPFTSGPGPLVDGEHHLFGLGADYAYASAGPYTVEAIDVPIDYQFNFSSPKWSLIFSLPLTATFTQGQWSVMASAGAGVQYRPFEWWSLTPMLRLGGAGSIDVGALGVLYSFTLTNQMHYDWRGIRFTMGNMVGFSKSIDGVEIGGLDLSYDITNPVLTNGLIVSADSPLRLFGKDIGWRAYGWNTQIFGDAVYMSSQTEVGASLGLLARSGGESFDRISLGISYLFGNNPYDGMSLRLRFRL